MYKEDRSKTAQGCEGDNISGETHSIYATNEMAREKKGGGNSVSFLSLRRYFTLQALISLHQLSLPPAPVRA